MDFYPYLMTGYPDPASYLELIDFLVAQGVHTIEAGVPFSDPAADGVTLTALNHDMVGQGHSLASSLELLAQVKKKHPDLKICLMSYLNPIIAMGSQAFVATSNEIGLDYLLFPDLPLHEYDRIDLNGSNAKRVMIVSDNLDDATIQAISATTSGYLYLLSFVGTTGKGIDYRQQLHDFAHRVRKLCGPDQRLVIGFGIKTKDDVDFITTLPVDGYIIGSQLVRELQAGGVAQAKEYVAKIVASG